MIDNNKIYNKKKGALNYKERRLIEEIKNALGDKIDDSFIPASNFSELEDLHNKYAGEEAQVVSSISSREEKTDNSSGFETSSEEEPVSNLIDPFNREEPIVRDYVLEDKFHNEEENKTLKSNFEEPTSFDDSFQLPTEDEIKKSSPAKKQQKEKEEPINPQYDEMTDAEKRKSTKKMAKAIVEGVSRLAEAGSIWWVTKDITEDKLVEYEINETMDLDLLLTLDSDTEITVKSWFGLQVKKADDLLRVSEQEKADLVESLYLVMLEKGIAPTPSQMLIINAITTYVIGLGVKAFAMSSEIKSVLNQLTEMKFKQKKAEREEQKQEQRQQTEQNTNYNFDEGDFVNNTAKIES